MMRVARMNERTQSLPVLLVLLPDEVVFVGKRPPDVGMGSQPGYDVADVALVDLSGQVAIFVLWDEQSTTTSGGNTPNFFVSPYITLAICGAIALYYAMPFASGSNHRA